MVRDKVAERGRYSRHRSCRLRAKILRIGLTLVVTSAMGMAVMPSLRLRVEQASHRRSAKPAPSLPSPLLEDELGFCARLRSSGRGLRSVDFGTSLGDGFYLAELACNARSHVLDHGEGGQDEGSRGVKLCVASALGQRNRGLHAARKAIAAAELAPNKVSADLRVIVELRCATCAK